MDDSTILKISFAISILGLMLLYLFSETLTVVPLLNETSKDGSMVKVKGIVRSIDFKNDSSIVAVEQLCTKKVYANKVLNISEGMYVEATGKIDGSMVFADEIFAGS